MFNIRPPATFLDSVGNPAVDYLVYVSKPNTDPTDDTQHVRLVDGITGQEVDNPFIVSHKGYAKNANGFVIVPQCAELKVAIRFESPDGGIQWEARQVTSDAFGLSPEDMGTPIADERINNFEVEALNADLTEYSFVFINSRTANWEDTADGPDYPYFAYKTSSIGEPSTGDFDNFFDANGNQWKIAENSQLPLDNEANIAGNSAEFDAYSERSIFKTDQPPSISFSPQVTPSDAVGYRFNGVIDFQGVSDSNYTLTLSIASDGFIGKRGYSVNEYRSSASNDYDAGIGTSQVQKDEIASISTLINTNPEGKFGFDITVESVSGTPFIIGEVTTGNASEVVCRGYCNITPLKYISEI